MHLVDLVLIALLAAGVFFAVRSAWRHRGGCGGSCAECTKSCAKRGGAK